jgi:hypothetical protein
MGRIYHKTAYQHSINLDDGWCEVIYNIVKDMAQKDRWAEVMKRKNEEFKPLFNEWLKDYDNSTRYYISGFNNQKFIKLEGFIVDFLKVYLVNRPEDFDQRLYFILDDLGFPVPPLKMPPEPEPPPPPCTPCHPHFGGGSEDHIEYDDC